MINGEIFYKLINNAANLALFEESNNSKLVNNIPKLFGCNSDNNCNLIIDWLKSEAMVLDDNIEITDGIYYVHSYISSKRIPIYFGKYWTKETMDTEDKVNYKLWDITNHNKPIYHHVLNVLCNAFQEQKPRSVLVKFDPNIKIDDVSLNKRKKLDVVDLNWNNSFLTKFDFLCGNIDSDKWIKECEKFEILYKNKKNVEFFVEIKRLITFWKQNIGLRLDFNKSSRMFTNLYRYAASLHIINKKNRTEVSRGRKTWPIVLYIPAAVRYNYRSGLVCNLKVNSRRKLSRNKIEKMIESISDKLFIYSNIIHSAEISLYQNRELLPMNTNGRPYQKSWLTEKATDMKTHKYQEDNFAREKMFKNMLAFRNAKGRGAPKINKIYKIAYNTMIELSNKDQVV